MSTWSIDPTHTQVEFAVKHMAISTVRGQFKTFSATGTTNDAGIPATLQMEIQVASISTNNEQRDGHLASPDFFDAAAFPTITFAATTVTGTPDALTIVGDLTIKGVTKPVTLTGEIASPIKDPWGTQRTSLSVTGKISRGDFGLTWNMALEAGGFLISDEVKLSIEAQATAA